MDLLHTHAHNEPNNFTINFLCPSSSSMSAIISRPHALLSCPHALLSCPHALLSCPHALLLLCRTLPPCASAAALHPL
jgi:hypothetical protein